MLGHSSAQDSIINLPVSFVGAASNQDDAIKAGTSVCLFKRRWCYNGLT